MTKRMQWLASLKKRYHNKIRGRILLYMCIIAFSIITCFSIFNFFLAADTIKKENEGIIRLKLSTACSSIESAVQDYSLPLYSIYISDSYKDMIYQNISDDTPVSSRLDFLRNFISVLRNTCTMKPEIDIYIKDSLYWGYPISYYHPVSEVSTCEWYQKVEASPKQAIIYSVEYSEEELENLLIGTVKIQHTSGVQMGIARITIPFSNFFGIFQAQFEVSNGGIYLCDTEGGVIHATGKHFGEDFTPAAYGDGDSMTYEGEKYFVFSENIEKYGWKLCYVSAERNVVPRNVTDINRIAVFAVVLIVASVVIMLLFSHMLTYKLTALAKNVEEINIDDPSLGFDPEKYGSDEVGILACAFEHAINKIKALNQKNLLMEKERYSIEYQALQEQVRPHFLNNSLSAVSSMAEDIGAYDIREALLSIAKFYRLSLSHGANLITVADEIELLKQYINICRLRFEDRVSLSLKVDQEALGCYTPKLVIQPFVENSIMHGLRTSGSDYQEDIVSINVKRSGDRLTIVIDDNGKGMDEQTLKNILMEDSVNKKRHAVCNVDRRIKLYFGEQYGVTIKSTPQLGTSVVITIPAMEDVRKTGE